MYKITVIENAKELFDLTDNSIRHVADKSPHISGAKLIIVSGVKSVQLETGDSFKLDRKVSLDQILKEISGRLGIEITLI